MVSGPDKCDSSETKVLAVDSLPVDAGNQITYFFGVIDTSLMSKVRVLPASGLFASTVTVVAVTATTTTV
jgi:hypothetical protein